MSEGRDKKEFVNVNSSGPSRLNGEFAKHSFAEAVRGRKNCNPTKRKSGGRGGLQIFLL